jgi:hypothetical protein
MKNGMIKCWDPLSPFHLHSEKPKGIHTVLVYFAIGLLAGWLATVKGYPKMPSLLLGTAFGPISIVAVIFLPSYESNTGRLRFYLRVLLAVGLAFGCEAGLFYAVYVKAYRPVPLRSNASLTDYFGRTVIVTANYGEVEKGNPNGFVYFGDEPVRIFWKEHVLPPKIGQVVSITGNPGIAGEAISIQGRRITLCLVDATWQ